MYFLVVDLGFMDTVAINNFGFVNKWGLGELGLFLWKMIDHSFKLGSNSSFV